MRKSRHARRVTLGAKLILAAASVMMAVPAFAIEAPDAAESVAARAVAVMKNAEIIAQGHKAYHARHGRMAADLDTLVKAGILRSWPATTHPSSDFFNDIDPVDDGGGPKYFVRFSFGEPDAEAICQKINEKGLGLASNAPVSATGIKTVDGVQAFDPPPAETVNRTDFCLKINDHYEYFHLISPKLR